MILNKSTVYLVGPMEYDFKGHSWRDKIEKELSKLGIISFNPYNKPFIHGHEEGPDFTKKLKSLMENGEFDEAASIMKLIRNEDLRLVDHASFIIAYINPKIFTCGSIEEISWACRCKKPIYIVIDGGKEKCPLWLMAMVPHVYIKSSFFEVTDELKKIDSGEIKIDISRWKIFKPQFR
jgi:nucleoside 2-deoxyribosyltransferase